MWYDTGCKYFLTFPSGLLYLGVLRTSKQFLPVLWTLRPCCGNSIKNKQLLGWVGHLSWVILANPIAPGPCYRLASVVDHHPVGGRWGWGRGLNYPTCKENDEHAL